MHIALLGNCQVPLIAEALRRGSPRLHVEAIREIHLLGPADEPEALARLARADVVLCQRVTHHFTDARGIPGLSTTALAKRFPGRVVTFPNLYFGGYAPDVRHLLTDGLQPIGGPLGDYHIGQVLDAYRRGDTAATAAVRLDGEELLAAAPDPFAIALEQIRAREKDTDVVISDVIRRIMRSGRHFHTPNHPSNLLLLWMAMRLAQAARLDFDPGTAGPLPTALDQIDLPAYPAILRRYGMAPDAGAAYRGVSVIEAAAGRVRYSGTQTYDAAQLTEAFYRVYDALDALPPG
ncbi:WcbI family polysaccharide biosynthesis putative acetyltransferase [Neoroseomonas soli]|uniref:Polysaccharide biosynthesis enzyme WcbI domain-containing protein n=1 Tax=Neoroseomonas soli TaxID=1081025 RepID=A0A9X9X187_9PROT|nr:WcbI family polysaccharide biosynthesis putative acetyltransferase [Neoroseomonas soli]MBR0673166.1 hypothetical protein [Neoroseomonas soli]